MAVTAHPSLVDEFDRWYRSDVRLTVDPYPFFQRLRAEAPIFRRGDLVVLSRYADCNAAAMNRNLWKTDGKSYDYGSVAPNELSPAHQQRLRQLFEMERLAVNKAEGDDHTRLRGLVQRAFTPRMVERMKGRIQEVADGLLDDVAPTGCMDAIADLAAQLPVIMLCDMLDIPVEDRHQLRWWSTRLVGLFSGIRDDVAKVVELAHENRSALFNYLRSVAEQRRTSGARPASVMATLLEAESGDRLSDDELVANTAAFVLAGLETTTNGIGNAVIALMTHRDQWELVRETPSLAASAADEALRYLSPVQTEPRFASRDVEVGGETIRNGQRLRMLWAAANRDPERFADPDRFDVTRSENKHLAFGAGRHFCLGASLAKEAMAIAIGTMARRFPDMQMAEDQPRWNPGFNVRGVAELPLILGADQR